MKPLTSILAVVGLAVGLSACSNTDPMNPLGYQPESKENLLAASGFKTLSLNTPAKVAAFKKLPPHRISQTTFKGQAGLGLSRPERLRLPLCRRPDGLQDLHQEGPGADDR